MCIYNLASICSSLLFLARGEVASSKRLVVEDVAQRKRIISSIHDANHLGVNRTNDMVACKYYWPGMFKNIQDYVSFIIGMYI